MKPAKKSVIISVTAAVIASLLVTTASAEGLYYTVTAARIESNAAALLLPANVSPDAVQQTLQPVVSKGSVIAEGSLSGERTVPVVVSDLQSSFISGATVEDMQYAAGMSVANFSKQFDGYRYVYGSASPKAGFDCSGLVYYVYSHFGYIVPRTAHLQYNNGTAVSRAELQPGDLVFFATNGGHAITHVGIYIGGNNFIHAATRSQGVIVSSLESAYWAKTLVGAKRIITPQAALQVAYQ
ncbi:Cell wall-associated hydrolase, NlpC family [Sporobacter termitidis DSM 10068]|uniref:Cell wall-associated hydrolase, NlpC family n=1 Tax=Sporobacter termitidis DSM 10068 TaxID=1123282 RepID=A0A1M5U813_9FIRM|nr:C40 family peptidase [Sporobacter termitidis]SHH59058.1 Cell wall-associated hydrolase, NlpC family [Sporobacter termitidis DSM 10068]